MHAISSYRGNRPTNTHTNPQTGPITIHGAAASAQRNYRQVGSVNTGVGRVGTANAGMGWRGVGENVQQTAGLGIKREATAGVGNHYITPCSRLILKTNSQ